jgi:hypothetical protein
VAKECLTHFAEANRQAASITAKIWASINRQVQMATEKLPLMR